MFELKSITKIWSDSAEWTPEHKRWTVLFDGNATIHSAAEKFVEYNFASADLQAAHREVVFFATDNGEFAITVYVACKPLYAIDKITALEPREADYKREKEAVAHEQIQAEQAAKEEKESPREPKRPNPFARL